MNDRHEAGEIALFRTFAKVCGLEIDPESITKESPPRPDIQCYVTSTGTVAFELVEIVDQGFANAYGKQVDTKRALDRHLSNLPEKERERFRKLYSNALIFPQFHSKPTQRQREGVFSTIFNHLLTLGDGFEGDTLENIPKLRSILSGISISRGEFIGPVFDSIASGAIGDPAVSAISSKFTKRYKCDHPIQLLAYIVLNPMIPEDRWLPRVQRYVQSSLSASQFTRVWVFDYQKSVIEFAYP